MSDSMAFVLHDAGDAAYADKLATLLSGVSSPLQNAIRFGKSAICAVVWTERSRTNGAEQRLIEALPTGADNMVLCCQSDVPCPESIRSRATHVTVVSGQPEADADSIGALVADVGAGLARIALENGRRTTSAPRLATRTANGTGASYRKTTFAARSATGLAATLAVVGIVGPMIVSRPAATAATNSEAKPAHHPSVPAHVTTTSAPTTEAMQTADGVAKARQAPRISTAAIAASAPAVAPATPTHAPAPFSASTNVVHAPTATPTATPSHAVTITDTTATVLIPSAAAPATVSDTPSTGDAVGAASQHSGAGDAGAASDAVGERSGIGYSLVSASAHVGRAFNAWPSAEAGQQSSAEAISAILEGRTNLSSQPLDASLWGVYRGAIH